MKAFWIAVGCLGGFVAGVPTAFGHELECEKEVNGASSVEISQFPARLSYRLLVRNIHPTSPSMVFAASDPTLEALGFEGFDTPFELPVDGELEKTFRVPVPDLAACLEMAAADGNIDTVIDNVFTVRWDIGRDICSARVECIPEGPPPGPNDGRRMTGGGSVFTDAGQRVTHGFQLRCDAADTRQNLEVNWAGNQFHLLDLTTADCQDTALDEEQPVAGFDTFIGTGTGRYNGVEGATIEFTFTDDGEPGVDDTARIVVRDSGGTIVLEVEDDLTFGNHQAHP